MLARLSPNPAIRESPIGYRSRPILSWARWRASAVMISLRGHANRLAVRVRGILVDAGLDLMAEVADQALDRPRSGVAQRADRMTLDLGRDLEQEVDLAL